ncbi:MAG TPA: VWA domain-containing protein [Pyrinomonadaceae bacterium]|jgi:VWFA-related protein|nr:VWA domain-containing protein [Pyrinomonadaceae bacterium]
MRKYACVLMLLSLLGIAVLNADAQTRPRRVGQTASQPSVPYTPGPRANPTSQPSAPATNQARQPPVLGGANRPVNQPGTTQAPVPAQNDSDEVGEGDVVRVNTTLVTIPVSVMDRNGKYIPNLRKEDFRIFEDGAEQQVAYFASVEKPFTVVLMIDTSGSTRFQLEEIQDAAIAFVNQLRSDDTVIVVSFDDQVRVLAEATNDRYTLRNAIRQTRTGNGTRLYDAVDMVIHQQLSRVNGRKAIVLFTDGVDTTSRHATYESTVRAAEELDALVYPVQYDTYDGSQGGGGGGSTWPGSSRMPPLRLPSILDIIIGGTSRNGGGGRGGGGGGRGGGGRGGGGGGGGGSSRDEYMRASDYLRELSERTGARLYQADSVQNLEHSFALVAEELRRQYSLGYYPRMTAQAGQRRQIKVRVNRPELAVRARDSYVVGSQSNATAQDTQQAPFLRKTRLVAVPEKSTVPPGR